MSAFKDDDTATPQSLLDETVRFAKMILADIATARIGPCKYNAELMDLSVYCLSEGQKNNTFVMNLIKDQHTFIEREPYNASHPAIVDSFNPVMKKILAAVGFHAVSETKYKDYRPNDFALGGCRTATSIIDFGISCHTDPEKLREAVMVDDAKLQKFCHEALEERFAEMVEFKKLMEANRIDVTNIPFNAEAFVAALNDAGLDGPERVVTIGKPPSPQKLH